MAANLSDDIFNGILLNENVWISNKISVKFILKGPMDNAPAALVHVIVWRRIGNTPLPEPMLTQFIDALLRH